MEDLLSLPISQLKERLNEITDMDHLSQLEADEKNGQNRKGALAAINERQGVLIDQKEVVGAEEVQSDIPASDNKEPEAKEEVEEDAEDEGPKPEPVTSEEEGTMKATPEAEVSEAEIAEINSTDSLREINDMGKREMMKPNHRHSYLELLRKRADVLMESEKGQKEMDELMTERAEEEAKRFEENRKEFHDKVRSLRLRVDRALQLTQGHFKLNNTSADESLFMAKSWLGNVLKHTKAVSPYTKADTPEKIPATAEKNEGVEFQVEVNKFALKMELDAVNEIRDQIEELKSEVLTLGSENFGGHTAHISTYKAWEHLCEARFILGNQLALIRR